MSREEDELDGKRGDDLVGTVPHAGDDPRFGDASSVDLVSNGAFTEIEDNDQFPVVDVEETPYMPAVVDSDFGPGYRPYVQADVNFEKAAGLEVEDREAAGDDILGDEFAGRMQQIDEASVDETGRALDDLAVHAQVAEARHGELTQRAPYRNINPESAYQGLLGGNTQLVSDDTRPVSQDVFQEVARWVGEDVQACPVTVTFSPMPVAPPAGVFTNPVIRPVVRIRWGTRDSRHSVIVDVGQGGQLTLGASNVYVELGLLATGRKTPFSLQASFAFYPVVRTEPLLLTSYLSIGAGGNTTVSRPNFATTIYDLERTDTASIYTLDFLDVTGTIIYTRTIAGGSFFTTPIGLSNDVDSVKVTDGGAGGTARLMWGICV